MDEIVNNDVIEQLDEITKLSDEFIIRNEEEMVSFLLDVLEIETDEELNLDRLRENESFSILYELLININCFTAAIEYQYVDRVYRDSYYIHYSCKLQNYDRYCKRIFLFYGDIIDNIEFFNIPTELLQRTFIGTICIRPTKDKKIGRSLINPYFVTDNNNAFLRYARYSVTISGKLLHINAFPYSMQDGETTTCAEITILNLLDYYSQRYSEYKYLLPSEIAEIVKKNGFERNLPSPGLPYAIITKVFSEAGFYPRLYRAETLTDISQFKRIVHYYIESGLPVAIGMKIDERLRHSIVCIGHGKINYQNVQKKIYAILTNNDDDHIWIVDTADLINEYVVIDDSQRPYANYEWKVIKSDKEFKQPKYKLGNFEPDTIMVPLYRRMFLEAKDAYDICTNILASKSLGIKQFMPEIGNMKNPLIIRLFMASARGFRGKRIGGFSSVNISAKKCYLNVLFPRFVWICELYTMDSYKLNKAIGEIVIDATASPHDAVSSAMIIHYPNQIMYSKKPLFDKLNNWESFDSYSNLVLPFTQNK